MSKTRNIVAALVVSAAGIGAISQYEGFRSEAYLDVGGVPTIGYGSTDGVKIGDNISKNDADRRLISELSTRFHAGINKCIKVPLYQNEYDAYLSLAYNIGTGAFCRSTLVKKLNKEDYIGACNEILRWNKVNKQVVKGLDNRRKEEYRMCINVESTVTGDNANN